jgi:signal transduction histidine kinase
MRGAAPGTLTDMPDRALPAQGLRIWVASCGALAVVLAVTLALGLTGRLAVVLPTIVALGIASWAVFRLRTEKAAHQEAIARMAAAEAVLEERLRIARDLHDIVSHGLGLITVRAATARHVHGGTTQAPDLLAAVDDVEALSRQATLELRRMLETLRDDRTPSRQPVDTLGALPEILAGAERAGLSVRLDQGDLGAVTPGVQLAVCAVVREGLANVARHAGASAVEVILRRQPEGIAVIVHDEGPSEAWAPTPGSGHGLLGLRERVRALGGTVEAGRDDGGFTLRATVPDGEP